MLLGEEQPRLHRLPNRPITAASGETPRGVVDVADQLGWRPLSVAEIDSGSGRRRSRAPGGLGGEHGRRRPPRLTKLLHSSFDGSTPPRGGEVGPATA